jgi:hypothetical protein
LHIVEIVGWLLASLGLFTAILWVYQVSMATLAHLLGAKVERVALGFDVFGYGAHQVGADRRDSYALGARATVVARCACWTYFAGAA